MKKKRTHYSDETIRILRQKYIAGVSIKEISKETGVSVCRVNSLIQKHFKIKRKKHIAKTGENHNVAKLTQSDVMKIYDLYLKGDSKINISNIFQVVHYTTIGKIINGKAWKHLYDNGWGEKLLCETQKRKQHVKRIAVKRDENSFFEVKNSVAICYKCGKPYPCKHTAKAGK